MIKNYHFFLLLCGLFCDDLYAVVKTPKQLLNNYNMCVAADYVYVKHLHMGVKSSWSYDLLVSVLSATGQNNMLDDRIKALHVAYEKVHQQDDVIGPVTIDQHNRIIDGHHYVAVALLSNKKVECTQVESNSALSPSYLQLKDGGMDPQDIDALVLEYMKINANCYIAIIWPNGMYKLDWIIDYIAEHLGPIVHVRPFTLKNYGQYILFNHIDYKINSTHHIPQNYYKKKFDAADLSAIVFETPYDYKEIKRVKGKIRAHVGGKWTSIHTEDSNKRSIHIGRMVLLENSIHHMNHMPLTELPKFTRLFNAYKKSMLAKELCCADNGTVLGAYGIREPGDWDFVEFKKAVKPTLSDIGGHNWFYNGKYTDLTAHDIIFNPRYHFYYKGAKFMSLDLLREIKGRKRVPKDIKDLELIKKHLKLFV